MVYFPSQKISVEVADDFADGFVYASEWSAFYPIHPVQYCRFGLISGMFTIWNKYSVKRISSTSYAIGRLSNLCFIRVGSLCVAFMTVMPKKT